MLSSEQEKMHSLSSEEKSLGYFLTSPYARPLTKTSHSVTSIVPLKSLSDTFESVGGSTSKNCRTTTFKIDTSKYHCLNYSFITQTLPAIEVDPDARSPNGHRYEIRWPENALFSILMGVTATMDDQVMTEISADYCLNHWQTHLDFGKRASTSVDIGNVPDLTEWSSSLPSWNLGYCLPMFYSHSPDDCFPLHLAGSENSFHHIIKTRCDLRQLLQLSEVIEENGVVARRVVPFNEKVILINGVRVSRSEDYRLDQMEMSAEYLFYTTEPELSRSRCMGTSEICNRFPYRRVWSKTLESNDKSFDSLLDHVFENLGMPIHTLFWSFYNKESLAYNVYHNPTTSVPAIGKRGTTLYSTLKKGANVIFENLDGGTGSRLHTGVHFASVPTINGLNTWTNCSHVLDTITPPGRDLTGYTLSSKVVRRESEDPNMFVMTVTAEGVGHYRFENCPVSDESRQSHRSRFFLG
jgi:hypothetical protein